MTNTFNNRLCELQNKYYQAQRNVLNHSTSSCLFDRHALEDMSLHGNISDYLGKEYQSMPNFEKRLRMPASPFLFVSRITDIVIDKNDSIGELKFEYDIPQDTPFQSHGYVHEFVLAESCHAIVILAYYLLKNELVSSPSALRGSNGMTEFFSDAPAVGETVTGHITVKSILEIPAGKILKQVYCCYHGNKKLLQLENYSAVVDPSQVAQVKSPIPQKTINTESDYYFTEAQLHSLFEKITWRENGLKNVLIHRAKFTPVGGLYNKGVIIGEYDITPDHWAFSAHFVHDPLFPASLMGFGIFQLLVFYILATDMLPKHKKLSPTHARDFKIKRKLINSILPEVTTLYFHLDIKEIVSSKTPKIVAKATLYTGKLLIAEFDDFGIEFRKLV